MAKALKRSFSKVTKGDFQLKSFAIKDGKYTSVYLAEESINDGLYETQPSIPRLIEPHKDLVKLLDELKSHLLNYQVAGTVLKRILKESKNKIITSQRVLDDVVSEMSSMLVNACNITKVTIDVKDVNGTEVKIIQIKGELTTYGDESVKIETPKINLEGNDYGLENQLKTIITEFEEEVYQYLFKAKVGGQMSLFNQDGDQIDGDTEAVGKAPEKKLEVA